MLFQLLSFPIGLMTIIDKLQPQMAIISILGGIFPSLLLLRSHWRVILTLLRRWESLFLTFYSIIFCTCVTLLMDNFFKSLFIWMAVFPALLASTFTDASAVRLDSAFLKGNLSVAVLTVPPYIITLAYISSIVILLNTRNTVGPKNTTISFSSTVTTSNINYGNIASSSGLTIYLFVVKSLTVLYLDSSRCVTLDAAMNIDIITLNKPIKQPVSERKSYMSKMSPSNFHLKSKMNSVGVDPGYVVPSSKGRCDNSRRSRPAGSSRFFRRLSMKFLPTSSGDIKIDFGAGKNHEFNYSKDDHDNEDEQLVLEAVFVLSGAIGLVPIRNRVTRRPFIKSLLFRSASIQDRKGSHVPPEPQGPSVNPVAHPVTMTPSDSTISVLAASGGLQVSSTVVNMKRRSSEHSVRNNSVRKLSAPAVLPPVRKAPAMPSNISIDLESNDVLSTDIKKRSSSVDFSAASFRVNRLEPSEDLGARGRNGAMPHKAAAMSIASTVSTSMESSVKSARTDGAHRPSHRLKVGTLPDIVTPSTRIAYTSPYKGQMGLPRIVSNDQIICPVLLKSPSTPGDYSEANSVSCPVAVDHFNETKDDTPPPDGSARKMSAEGIAVPADTDTPTPAPMTARQSRLYPFYVRADAIIFGADEYTLISPATASILISDESETVAMKLFGEAFDLKLRVFVKYFWYPALLFQLGCLPIGLLTLLGGLPTKGAYFTIPGAVFPIIVLLQCHWKIFVQLLMNWEQIFLTIYSAIFCICLSLITTGRTRTFYIWLVIFPSLIASAFSDASSTRLDNTFLNKKQKNSMIKSVFLFALPPYVASLSYIFSIVAMLNLKFDVMFDFASSLPMKTTVLNANMNYSITACSTGFTITLFLLKCLFFLITSPNQCVSLRSPMAVHIAILEPPPTNVAEREAGCHVLEARFAIQRGGGVVAGSDNDGDEEKETIGEPKRIFFRCRNPKDSNSERFLDRRKRLLGSRSGSQSLEQTTAPCLLNAHTHKL